MGRLPMSNQVIIEGSGLEGIEFFGDIDMHAGKVASEMPAWYMDSNITRMEDKAGSLERDLADENTPASSRASKRAELAKCKDKLDRIKNSKPKVKGTHLDALAAFHDELSEKIGEQMFTRTEDARNLANVNQEFMRATGPCIEVKGDQIALAKSCGIRILEKRGSNKAYISRNDATRLWKMAGRILDKDTNAEILRRN